MLNVSPYDALLICSFGGPNRPADVMPFLRNVVDGRGVPDDRLAEVAEHYFHFGGASPINEQNLALRAAVEAELRRRGSNLPVLWSNRNWHPYTADVLRNAAAFGAKRVLVLVTSAYASYSGSRQYREHLASAREASETTIELDIIRPFFNDPGFVLANTDAVMQALAALPASNATPHVVYVTHSIPDTMQAASAVTGPGYVEQHEEVRRLIDDAIAERGGQRLPSTLAYCSRSGDPRTPWLEPDINDHLTELKAQGVRQVVLAPIGFISDHMEVAFDLDTEAAETAQELGLDFARAATSGVHPAFVSGIVDLVVERATRERGERSDTRVLGELGAFPDVAPPGSCRAQHMVISGVPVLAGDMD